MKPFLSKFILWVALVSLIPKATLGVQIQSKKAAYRAILGMKGSARIDKVKVKGKVVKIVRPKNKRPKKVAVLQEGLYPPDCTHTWVIGINYKTVTVDQIRAIEMKCHHAFPTYKQAGFYAQFEDMGKADLEKLENHQIDVVAKATGTSHLTADAVATAIRAVLALRGKS